MWRVVKPGAVVWKGDREFWECPLAHQNTCRSSLHRRVGNFVPRIPWVNDPQAACGSPRANFWLRAIAPKLTAEFAPSRCQGVGFGGFIKIRMKVVNFIKNIFIKNIFIKNKKDLSKRGKDSSERRERTAVVRG